MLWLQQVLFGGTLPGMSAESREFAEQRHGTSTFGRRHKLQSFHKVLYDAVGELSPGLSEEAFSTLCCDARSLEMNQITLNFRDAGKLASRAATRGSSFYTAVFSMFKDNCVQMWKLSSNRMWP